MFVVFSYLEDKKYAKKKGRVQHLPDSLSAAILRSGKCLMASCSLPTFHAIFTDLRVLKKVSIPFSNALVKEMGPKEI